jgi:hypothetical protein
MKTFDDIRDLAIKIVDDLVQNGIVKDCTDTENEDEFNVQDAVIFRLLDTQKDDILSLYSKDKFSATDKDLIYSLIDYEVVGTEDIVYHWKGWAIENYKDFWTNDVVDMLTDFNEHYANGKTHPENWNIFLTFIKNYSNEND